MLGRGNGEFGDPGIMSSLTCLRGRQRPERLGQSEQNEREGWLRSDPTGAGGQDMKCGF